MGKIAIYRAVIADTKKDADRYIKSSARYGGRDYGSGVYWTEDIDIARSYGNFVYRAEVDESDIKKKVSEQSIVILTGAVNKSLDPILVDRLDLGLNAKYSFAPILWKKPDRVKELQAPYKEMILNDGGKLVESTIARINNLFEKVETDTYISRHELLEKDSELSKNSDYDKIKQTIVDIKGDSYFETLLLEDYDIEQLRKRAKSLKLKEFMTIESKNFPDYDLDVPQDRLLLFHNTSQENAEIIAKEGLKADAGSKQGRGKDGDYIWATSTKNAKGYGGYTVAFIVDKDKAEQYKVNDTEYTLPFDIPASDIMFIDEPIGLNNYRESDLKELINKFGEDKVAEVLSKKTNLDSDAIGMLMSSSLNESVRSEIDRLNDKYKDYLLYPYIYSFRNREYADDKKSKYITTYTARVKNRDPKSSLNVDFYAKSLEDLDTQIEKYLKGSSDSLHEWGEETSEDIEYRELIKIIKAAYPNFKFTNQGITALRNIAKSAEKKLVKLAQEELDREKDHPKYYTKQDGTKMIRNDAGGYEELDEQDLGHRYGDLEKSDELVEPKSFILYHCSSNPNLSSFDTEHFGEKSSGGLTYGDAIYFCDSIEQVEWYNSHTSRYVYECQIVCNKVISDREYSKILSNIDVERNFDNTAWNTKETRNIMLSLGIDAVDNLPSEFALFNLDCIKSVKLVKTFIDESEKLTEANLLDLINDSKATDPRRIQLAQSIYTSYKGLDSDGTLLFESDSQTRSGLTHRQRVFYPGFFDLLDIVDAGNEITEEQVVDIITNDLMVDCSCFTGDTLVTTSEGFKQIRDIKVGDKVLTHTGEYRNVITVFEPHLDSVVHVKIGSGELVCTKDHRFLTSSREWLAIDKCRNECLLCYDNTIKSSAPIGSPIIKDYNEQELVYNIEVEKDRSYCVGLNRVIVHNCESFLYYAWAYKSWSNDYGLMKELRVPKKNNVSLKGGACKHVLSVLDLINRSDTLFNQVTRDLNVLFQRYKKQSLQENTGDNGAENHQDNE